MSTVDLNADLGEGFGRWTLGDDDALLDVVTSANVACGFHAGDPLTLRRVCGAAVAGGVVIGAQVGYRDLATHQDRGGPTYRVGEAICVVVKHEFELILIVQVNNSKGGQKCELKSG